MNLNRRLEALERRLPADPEKPEPEFIPLPPLAEFQAISLEQQTHVLLGWEPVLDETVNLPWPPDLDAMTDEDWGRLFAALERVGREILLPYVESLPMDERIKLLREATLLLPPSQIWRLKAFRFACRPEWRRRMEGQPNQLETKTMPVGEN
jgi:hypothetical protein